MREANVRYTSDVNGQVTVAGKDAFDLWRDAVLAWGERLEREDPPVLWLSPAGTWVPLRKAAEIKKAVNGKL